VEAQKEGAPPVASAAEILKRTAEFTIGVELPGFQ
jgi:hypothetical protein